MIRLLRCALLLLAAAAAQAQQISYEDILRQAEAQLKKGEAMQARHMAIVLANTALMELAGERARHPLQRAALIRAYADRDLKHDHEAEYYWYIAKTLSTSDAEMTIEGVQPLAITDLHATSRMVEPPIAAPKPLKPIALNYPEATRKAGMQIPVVLELVIDDKGIVRQPLVITPYRSAALEYAAMEAAALVRWEPATLDGKAIPVRQKLTTNFVLKKEQ